jgi:hypothetical protein
MLRHFLAALAYRTQKAIRGAPDDYWTFDAGNKVRSPHELICHMRSVLGYARTFFIGGNYRRPTPQNIETDIEAFHAMLADLSRHLEQGTPLIDMTEEQLLQGPFADAMTHAGQLAMLRRMHGHPSRRRILSSPISRRKISAPINPNRQALMKYGQKAWKQELGSNRKQ